MHFLSAAVVVAQKGRMRVVLWAFPPHSKFFIFSPTNPLAFSPSYNVAFPQLVILNSD